MIEITLKGGTIKTYDAPQTSQRISVWGFTSPPAPRA